MACIGYVHIYLGCDDNIAIGSNVKEELGVCTIGKKGAMLEEYDEIMATHEGSNHEQMDESLMVTLIIVMGRRTTNDGKRVA